MKQKIKIFRTGRIPLVILIFTFFIKLILSHIYIDNYKYEPNVFVAFLFSGIIIFLAYSAFFNAKEHQSKIQFKRDDSALNILEMLKSYKNLTEVIPEQEFKLLLRPFISINILKVDNPDLESIPLIKQLIYFFGTPFIPTPPKLTFEFVLMRYLEENLKFKIYAIGGVLDEYGPGRVFLPDTLWKYNFELFANASQSIILIPGYSPSSLWEANWIIENKYLQKTVIIMPGSFVESKNIKIEEYWNITQQKYKELGLLLPDFIKFGLIFKFDNAGIILSSQSLSYGEPDFFSQNYEIVESS